MRNGILMAVAAYLCWGLLTPVGKILLEDLGPMSLNSIRMVVAMFLLIPLVPRDVFAEGVSYLRRKEVVLLVLIGNGINFTLFTIALTRLDATFATLGFYTAPMWTAIVARLWLGERVGWTFLPASVLLLVGGWLAIFGRDGADLQGPGFDMLGMVLAGLSAVTWGVYSVGLRKYAPGLRLRSLIVASFIVATAFFVVAGAIMEGVPPVLDLDLTAWAWMMVHVAIPTLLALLLFNAALQRAPAAYVNVLIGVELAATVLFSMWLLGDRFDAWQFTGLAVALIAVSGYLWERARIKAPG